MGADEVAPGVWQLQPVPGINVWALRGTSGWTLVDTAVPGATGAVVRALDGLGVRRGDVERIVLTHAHLDHAGGAAALRDRLGAQEVLVGGGDLADVRAGRNAGRNPAPATQTLLGRVVRALPGGYPAVRGAATPPATISVAGEGDLEVVPTPGHTAGHVALRLGDVVIGGDALFNVFRLRPSPAFLCSDVPASLRSLTTLADLEPRVLLLAHGSAVDDDPAGRLRQLAAGGGA